MENKRKAFDNIQDVIKNCNNEQDFRIQHRTIYADYEDKTIKGNSITEGQFMTELHSRLIIANQEIIEINRPKKKGCFSKCME